jgi:hypothetical protein
MSPLDPNHALTQVACVLVYQSTCERLNTEAGLIQLECGTLGWLRGLHVFLAGHASGIMKKSTIKA